MSEITYSKEKLENYFKKNYPINWYTWLSKAFDSLNDESLDKINNNYIGDDNNYE